MNLGAAISRLRKKYCPDLNQGEFARKVGITQTSLSLIENGKKPNYDTLERIAKAMDIPLPFITWEALEETDISEGSRIHFEFFKKTIDEMIKTVFEDKI